MPARLVGEVRAREMGRVAIQGETEGIVDGIVRGAGDRADDAHGRVGAGVERGVQPALRRRGAVHELFEQRRAALDADRRRGRPDFDFLQAGGEAARRRREFEHQLAGPHRRRSREAVPRQGQLGEIEVFQAGDRLVRAARFGLDGQQVRRGTEHLDGADFLLAVERRLHARGGVGDVRGKHVAVEKIRSGGDFERLDLGGQARIGMNDECVRDRPGSDRQGVAGGERGGVDGGAQPDRGGQNGHRAEDPAPGTDEPLENARHP